MRILVVEDERDLNAIIAKKLAAEGYAVDCCYDGEDALYYLEQGEFDAVVLDIMLPKRSGLAVLQAMRAGGNVTPVILLTARDTVEDRVRGLDTGANDYLIKPFSLQELLARIRAMTRQAAHNPTNVFTLCDLLVDCAAHTVQRGGTQVSLSAKEFAILEYLIRNRGIVLSREKIETHVWNYAYEGGSNVVDVYIRNLRRKLDDAYSPKLIHTIRGSGYVLREDT